MRLTRAYLMFFATLLLASAGLVFSGSSYAQQKTVEEKQTGPTEMMVDTKDTTVAYVEGNHLVVRLADGSLEAMRIPMGEHFDIDGESLTLSELKPGMVLTKEIVTTSRPMVVKTVEVADGTVWFASGSKLIIRLKDGKTADYTVPEWAKLTVNGEEGIPLHQLRQGQQITATFITEEPMTMAELKVTSHGHYGTAERETAVEQPEPAATQKPEVARAAEPPTEVEPVAETKELPQTASPMPLIGLMGLMALGVSLGLRAFRKIS